MDWATGIGVFQDADDLGLVNFNCRMGIGLGWLFCQNVLRMAVYKCGELREHYNGSVSLSEGTDDSQAMLVGFSRSSSSMEPPVWRRGYPSPLSSKFILQYNHPIDRTVSSWLDYRGAANSILISLPR